MRSLRSGGGTSQGEDEDCHPIKIYHASSASCQGSVHMRGWHHCPSVRSTDDVRLAKDFEATEVDPPRPFIGN